ncbi:acetolactate synthase small subunit [ANME-1 cluster archaeon ex4572_4]|nr:acetolactate synthase small subunit [Methanophagales archaeon]OYT66251.1 MAG: acetolactate synthase small subunit [ANME-1 cluster archaeon ex4572_4]PXF51688.1 MAG: acetolactate synthase small subunit [Methanophagales archaeon]HDN68933.1 acetolactate synthase small subunit [Methanomicrobia archaeon]
MQTHIISLLVEDHPGVLTRMSGMFTTRGINIASLTVSPCEKEGLSRMTIAIEGSESELEKVRKQISNLIEVVKVVDLKAGGQGRGNGGGEAIVRDLCLLRVHAKDSEARSAVMQLAESYGAKIVDAALDSVTLELTEEPERVSRFVDLMRHFGVKQLFRTGVTAIGRERD